MPKKTTAPDPTPTYAVLAWKGMQATPSRLNYGDPIVALTNAIEYLKAGYQVRLSNACVEWYECQPVPDVALHQAATVNGQAAAFTGPPRLGGGKLCPLGPRRPILRS